MNKIEYHIVDHLPSLSAGAEADVLNGYGDFGWRLVTVVPQGSRRRLYFTREIRPEIVVETPSILDDAENYQVLKDFITETNELTKEKDHE